MQKPDPQMLRLTIRRAGGELHRAVMVGDSRTDGRTARAANVPVIAVDFGYSEVPVATLHPDRVIGSFAELPAALAAVERQYSPATATAVAPIVGTDSIRCFRLMPNILDRQGFIRHTALPI